MSATIDGIGYLEVAPTADTTYTLTLNGTLTAQATIRVFPGRAAWDAAHFSPEELADPAKASASTGLVGRSVRERSPWAVLPTMHFHEAKTEFRRYDISRSESHNLHSPFEPIHQSHPIKNP